MQFKTFLKDRRVKKITGWLPAGLGIFLLVISIYVIGKEFRHLSVAEIVQALDKTSYQSLFHAAAWTFLSYAVMTGYDYLGVLYAKAKLTYGKISFASFCAYSLAHNLGFAALSGGAVRYRLYASWGVPPFQIAKIIAFCSITFALGGLALGGFVLLIHPQFIPLWQDFPLWGFRVVGVCMLLTDLGYILASGFLPNIRIFGHEVSFPGLTLAVLQVLIAAFDVGVTAAIFHALLPAAAHVSYFRVLAIYLLAYSGGLLANIPGGIGVFDGVILLGLSPFIPAATLFGALFFFRIFYYIIPLFLAGGLFAGNEVVIGMRQRFGVTPRFFAERFSDLAVSAAVGLTVISGLALLVVNIAGPFRIHRDLINTWAHFAPLTDKFISSLLGMVLLALSPALGRRVTYAWCLSIPLLFLAAIIVFLRGQTFWFSLFLIFAALALIPLRGAFYRSVARHGRYERRIVIWRHRIRSGLILIIAFSVLFLASLAVGHENVSPLFWWQALYSRQTPFALRVGIGVCVVIVSLLLYWVLHPHSFPGAAWDSASAELLPDSLKPFIIGKTPDGFMSGDNGNALLPFWQTDRLLIGIGDPLGAEEDKVSAIWQLRDYAARKGLIPVIWQASGKFLPIYRDIGLSPLVLGQDNLPDDRILLSNPAKEQNYLLYPAGKDKTVIESFLETVLKADPAVKSPGTNYQA